jgi:hypothetical protein
MTLTLKAKCTTANHSLSACTLCRKILTTRSAIHVLTVAIPIAMDTTHFCMKLSAGAADGGGGAGNGALHVQARGEG